MDHLTSRWASLREASPQAFVATFLVSRRENWTPDDYLGAAVAALPADVLAADVTRGSLVSIRLRFFAPDEATAWEWAREAERSCGSNAHFTDALNVRRGRATARDRSG